MPLVSTASSAAYEGWALEGAAGACPYCGAHAVRDGGCSTVQCGWCRRSYTFRPFRNVAALRGAVAVGEVAPPLREDPTEPIRVSIVSLVYGLGVSTTPGTLLLFDPGWEAYVILVPLILGGTWLFVEGLFSLRVGVREIREERVMRQRQQAAAAAQEGGAGAQEGGHARARGGGGGISAFIEVAVVAVGLFLVALGLDWGIGAILVRQYQQRGVHLGLGPYLVTMFMRRQWGRRLNSLSTLLVGGAVWMTGVVILIAGMWLSAAATGATVIGWWRRRAGRRRVGNGGGVRGTGVGSGAGGSAARRAAGDQGVSAARAGLAGDRAAREQRADGLGERA